MEDEKRSGRATSRAQALFRLAGLTALAALALIVLVVVVCWLAGWRNAPEISNALSITGAIVIVLGLLSTMGGWGLARDAEYMYAQSVSDQSLSERTRQGLRDSLRGYNLAILTTVVGILCIGASALLSGLT